MKLSTFLKISIFSTILTTCLADCCDIQPYLGADFSVRYMDFQKGFGEKTLYHQMPQGNLYGGLKLTDGLGIEFGYHVIASTSRKSVLTTGEVANGVVVPVDVSPVVFKSTLKIKGPHIDMVAFHPLSDYSVKLISSVGISLLKGTSERCTQQFYCGLDLSGNTRIMSNHKFILSLMTGLQFEPTEHLFGRFSIGWINTRRMKMYDHAIHKIPAEVKPKNSISCSIGGGWMF